MRWSVRIEFSSIVTMLAPKRRWIVHKRLLSSHHIALRHKTGIERIPVCEYCHFSGTPGGRHVLKAAAAVTVGTSRFRIAEFTLFISSKLGGSTLLKTQFGFNESTRTIWNRIAVSTVERND